MPWCSAVSATRASASASCCSIVGASGEPSWYPAGPPPYRRSRGTVDRLRCRGTVHRLRSRGTVRGSVRPSMLTQRLPRRRNRLNEHGTRLRLQPRADDDHTVVIVIHMQGAVFVPARRLFHFELTIDATPAAHDPLKMFSRAGQPDLEQTLFDLRSGDPRERPDLRI